MLQLEKCGVEVAKATLVERSDEKYVALKGHRQLGRQESTCIAKVLVPADVGLRADNPSTDGFYADAWEAVHRSSLAKRARDWLKQHRPDVKLVKYQPDQPLQDYVMSIEMACGAQSGTAHAEKQHRLRYIWFPKENPGDPKTDCVEVALTAGLEDEDVQISRWKGVE